MWQTPPYNPQSSTTGADATNCVSEAVIHVLEMLQGNFQRWSPRALAKLSGTTPQGNNIQTVVNAVNRYGLIPYDLWPDLETFTWQDYYATIPQEILQRANKNYQINLIAPDINASPVLLRLEYPDTFHFVAQFNGTQYFDSYLPDIKPINPSMIVGKWSLQLILKSMTFGYSVPGNPTVYIQVGNSLVPLSDWQAFVNLGGSAASVVTISQGQLDESQVIASDYFKSK